MDHKLVECKQPKKKKNHEANVVDSIAQNITKISLSIVVSEVNMVCYATSRDLV